MALPVSIDAGGLVQMPSQNYYCGPFISGGNVYVIVLDSSGSRLDAYKATDPTDSFTIQDDTGNPSLTGDVASMWIYQNDTTLFIITYDTTNDVDYCTFNMSTDQWGSLTEIASITDPGDNLARACSIGLRSDADIVVLYQGESHKDMGSDYSHVVYDVSTDAGSTWAGATLIDPDVDETNYRSCVIVPGASDRMHFFYKDDTNSNIYHRSLSSADALDNNDAFETDARAMNYPLVPGISYVDTQTKVRVGYKDGTNNDLAVASFDSGADPTITVTDGVSDSALREVAQTIPGCLVVDGTDEYALFTDSTADLFYDVNTGSGWGTDTEALDAVTVNALSANVYDRSGTKIAYLYDDAGTVKYNEIDLGGAPSSTGTLALLGSIVGG